MYLPVVSQREDGDESTTVVDNNEENIYGGYDEEEVCQEIEDQLGVLPVRFGYCPKDMRLEKYRITEEKEAVLKYTCESGTIHVYISKDYNESSINFKMDGALKDTAEAEGMFMEIPIYEYSDDYENEYLQTSFEYLNTYYSISGMLDEQEFKKLLENIYIKNV